MLQLARMYLTVDDLDACQQQCVQLLKMDSENDDATVVSWDVLKTFSYHPMVIRGSLQFTQSFHVFSKKLLTVKNSNWHSIARKER